MAMKVELIAETRIDPDKMAEITGYVWQPEDCNDADALAEFSGRLCYLSWNRPNPKTRKNHDYIANIINQKHFSVLSHASASFYLEGVSRSLTHELIRHRWLSFSELSQRYVNAGGFEFVVPPALMNNFLFRLLLRGLFTVDKAVYRFTAWRLEKKGLTRKQAREAARSILPGGTETKMVVSGNLRAFRDMLSQRLSTSADAEIRRFAQKVLAHLKDIAPASFQDFEETV